MDWQNRLDIFLSEFEHKADLVGVLVCGSYITGNPSPHSDLDVHLVLDNSVGYRERGNRFVDGLHIEYFANPPYQILQYFDEDFADKRLHSQVMFATGKIVMDKNGEVATLKKKAYVMLEEFYKADKNESMGELAKLMLWDRLDDLQDAYKLGRADFDFLYFTALDEMFKDYMNTINRPYGRKVILGNIIDAEVRGKYLLRELPDAEIAGLIAGAITAVDRDEKMRVYQHLTELIWDRFGGFEIDGFRFRSDTERKPSS